MLPDGDEPREDYYRVLGVERGATTEQIRRAFQSLAKELHPDSRSDRASAARFQAAKEAYDVLRTDSKRRAYDAALHRRHGSPLDPFEAERLRRRADEFNRHYRPRECRAWRGAAGMRSRRRRAARWRRCTRCGHTEVLSTAATIHARRPPTSTPVLADGPSGQTRAMRVVEQLLRPRVIFLAPLLALVSCCGAEAAWEVLGGGGARTLRIRMHTQTCHPPLRLSARARDSMRRGPPRLAVPLLLLRRRAGISRRRPSKAAAGTATPTRATRSKRGSTPSRCGGRRPRRGTRCTTPTRTPPSRCRGGTCTRRCRRRHPAAARRRRL
jgi:hypothetical protein